MRTPIPHRTLIAGALALALGPAFARTASAEEWCWNDPLVEIGGKSVRIRTGVRGAAADVDRNVDEARVVIIIPHGVEARVLASTSDLYDEKTRLKKARNEFRENGRAWRPGEPIPVRVEVSFRAKKDFPAVVVVEHRGGSNTASGRTDRTIVVEFTLP